MDLASERLLAHVATPLAEVIRRAAQYPQPFRVICGLRSLEAEREAVDTGHSQTMHSRHLSHTGDGFAYAVDVAPIIGGKLSFAPGHAAHYYGAISLQIHQAASLLAIPIEWGGDWVSLKDYGHFQLPWKDYP